MKQLLTLLAAVAIVAAGCASGDGEFESVADTPENRAVAAERYEAAMPVEVLLEELVYSMVGRVAEDQRDAFLAHMAEAVDVEGMREVTHEVMVRHFTADELNAQAAFYESEEGKSVAIKSRAYMAELMPRFQSELVRAASEWMAAEGGQAAP